LSADLEKNSPNLNIINSYLGTNAKEEKIIDYIDFLARNSSVSLVDISVEKATKPVVLAAVDNSTAKVSDINFTGIKINIFGEYEKIQMFADGLSRMELFNEILEYNILKIKETVAAEGAPPANPNMLSADFSIRVGYSPFVKNAKYDNLNENQTTLDFSVANKIQTIIKKSTPTLVLNGSGKSNPFLP
jgi:hypothetical protein